MAKISIIAAIGKNRELGRNNKLLWHIPEDLKRFKKITQGHPVIMGRKTYQSIGKVLPNRVNIIITRDKNLSISPSSYVANSLEKAINIAQTKDSDEIFIIGGGQIYEQAMKYTDKLYLTIVEGEHEADTYFPDYSEFKKIVLIKKGESAWYKYTFLELEKQK